MDGGTEVSGFMEWTLKRKVVIWSWVLMILVQAVGGAWAFSMAMPLAGWVAMGIVVFLLIAGPGRWATMFLEEKKGWWLHEDL